MKKLAILIALACMISAPLMAYDVEDDYILFENETVSSGSYLATDRFGAENVLIEGGQFGGRWLVYGDADFTGGEFNAAEVTDYEPDGTPYQKIQGGLYFRGDSTKETTISGGDFTGLVYTELGGGMKELWNGEGTQADSGEHTVHIRGGSWADNQGMYAMNNSKTFIYGTDFQIDVIVEPAVGIPVFPTYQPEGIKRSSAIISCTLEDGTPFSSEWRFWEAESYGQDRYFNFGTVFEVEWRYDARFDKDNPDFDGYGWFPKLDGSGDYIPYFASGESYDGAGDDHWEGSLVLVDVSQETPIPEPATTALLGLAALGGFLGSRRRK